MPYSISPRRRLHHAIRNSFATVMSAYYKQNPERVQDETQFKFLLKLLDDILQSVDQYDICDLGDKHE